MVYSHTKNRNLTFRELFKIYKDHDYVLLTDSSESWYAAVNCKLARLPRFADYENDNGVSRWRTAKPIGIVEYVALKNPVLWQIGK